MNHQRTNRNNCLYPLLLVVTFHKCLLFVRLT